MAEREFQNMFTFACGFEAATLKIPSSTSGNSSSASATTTTTTATATELLVDDSNKKQIVREEIQ